jgi:hypothetical protein
VSYPIFRLRGKLIAVECKGGNLRGVTAYQLAILVEHGERAPEIGVPSMVEVIEGVARENEQ